MPYVKISDPNTIDLASWQQVVNVVNQHSDSINAITNNFGAQTPVQSEWNTTEDFAYEYDPNSQKVIFGRTLIDATSPGETVTIANSYVHWIDVLFSPSGGTFSSSPVVTVTGRHSSTTESLPHNLDIIITVQEVTESGFRIRIVNSRSRKTAVNTVAPLPLDPYNFYVNWIAFGPK
jgi:hypothetical protein